MGILIYIRRIDMGAILTIPEIKKHVAKVAKEYNLHRVSLFGSYASGKRTKKSDIDLLVDFGPNPVSILKVCGVKVDLEDLTGKDVDVIPAPLSSEALIEIKKEILLYDQNGQTSVEENPVGTYAN